MLCDYKSLLNLIQTERNIYNQRKFLYKIAFQNLIFTCCKDLKFPFYPIIESNSIHIYNMISLFNRNKFMRKWFLDCKFYAYASLYSHIKLFYKNHHNDIKNNDDIIELIKLIENYWRLFNDNNLLKNKLNNIYFKPFKNILLSNNFEYKFKNKNYHYTTIFN
jgi:predicted amidophosphoribosyltransferase